MAAFMHVRKAKTYRELRVYRDLTDTELVRRFRFNSAGIQYLSDLVGSDINHAHANGRSLSTDMQVMIALRYLASNDFQLGVADDFGISQPTVSTVVKNFSLSLNNHMDQFIKMPSTISEKNASFHGFYRLSGFPKVFGCLDCTHVRIIKPSDNGADYMSRKGFYSLNVQAVCDFDGQFTNFACSWPGSTHDSHILRTSNLWRRYEETPPNAFILADNAYPNRDWLLTPFLNPRTDSQGRYNVAHKSTRIMIEQCFGRLKRRFSILHSEMRVSPEKAVSIIASCFILHNIAIQLNQPEPDEEQNASVDDGASFEIDHDDNNAIARNRLVQQFFSD